MSLWIDHKYISLLSNRLQFFKQKDKEIYNFRCPICNDSERKKTKARGYVFNKAGKLRFYCHNCGTSMLLGSFIKTIDVALYEEYNREKFIENNFSDRKPVEKKQITDLSKPSFLSSNSPLRSLKKISQLSPDHPFKRYVVARRIPSNKHYKLFFCEKFKSWVNSFLPGKFENVERDEPRIILPFLDREKKFFGCQGRSTSAKGIRYITIMVDENKPKIFGLDECDFNKQVYCTEGPIDSLFIPNSIAMCGSDLSSLTAQNRSNITMVFDNEARSKEIVNKMDKYIAMGYNICIWPATIKGKDINEMILNDYCQEELKIIIDKNTYTGIEAKLNLENWRKC